MEPALHEFSHIQRADGTIYDHAQPTPEALLHDPDGLAVSTLRYIALGVKPLPFPGKDGPATIPTAAAVIDGTYSLGAPDLAFSPSAQPAHAATPQ